MTEKLCIVKISIWILERVIVGYYKRLRDMREDHDLTQRQLAAKLEMPQAQYCRYEQGKRDIPTEILIQLADMYQTSTDYLLGRTDDPVYNPSRRR